jgi:hypothetical protein
MAERDRPRRSKPDDRSSRPLDPAPWWREGDEEVEPDWADEIRALRRDRGDRLKDVFATFDDDDPSSVVPDDPSPPPRSRANERPEEPPA